MKSLLGLNLAVCLLDRSVSQPCWTPYQPYVIWPHKVYHCQSTKSPNMTAANEVSRKDSLRKTVFRLFDLFLIIFIITPCSILSWRGTWLLIDIYLLPTNAKANSWISFLAGLSYIICAHFLQDILKHSRAELHTIHAIYVIVTRLYYYLAGVFLISVWRGFWDLLDAYTGKSIANAVISSILGFAVIIPFRGVNNLSFPPGFLSLDWNENPFDLFHTRFKMQEREATFLDAVKHVADLLLSYVVLIPASVTIWRGIWEGADLLLYPENPQMTGIISTVYGYTMFIIVLIVHPCVQRLSLKLSRFWLLQLIFLQFYAFIKFTAVNSMWRGVWYLLDSYLFPDSPRNRGITAHLVGFTVLIILGASRSAGEVMFEVDGAEEPEPVQYLPLLRKVCTNRRYSLLINGQSEEASSTASDEDKDSSSDESTHADNPDVK